MLNFGNRIVNIRKKLGMTQQEFAKKLEILPQALARYEKNKSTPSVEFTGKLTNMFNVNSNWLLTGKGEMFLNNEKNINISNCEDDCVEIGYLEDMVASAGGGGDSSSGKVKMVKISRYMLNEFKISNVKKANLIKVFGDSMEPLFKSGDIAVVERVDSIDEVRNGNIVVATIAGDVYIKKIEKDPFRKRVIFKSENSIYQDITAEKTELELIRINSIVKGKMRVF